MRGARRADIGTLWLRRAGAVLLWALLEAVFLLPRGFARGGAVRFLFPPVVGAVGSALVAAGFVWWFAVRVVRRREWWRAAHFRLRPVPRGAWPWIAATAVAIVVGVQCSLIVLPRIVRLPEQSAGQIASAYLAQPFGAVGLLILTAAVAPVLEEFLFRGWMQRGLERRLPVWGAIVVTALVFAAVHAERFGFPLRVGFALASGYAAWATRSIWPSVVLHSAYNGALIVLGALTPEMGERQMLQLASDPRVFWPALGGLVVSVLVIVGALRGLRRAALRARRERAGRTTTTRRPTTVPGQQQVA